VVEHSDRVTVRTPLVVEGDSERHRLRFVGGGGAAGVADRGVTTGYSGGQQLGMQVF
jgi:hypothetical protein